MDPRILNADADVDPGLRQPSPATNPLEQSWGKAAEDLPIMCEASFAGCMDVVVALAEVRGYLIF